MPVLSSFILCLMFYLGWDFFEDDRVLFVLIVLYVVVVGGIYALLRHKQQTALLHPAIQAVLFVHWLVLAAPLRLARKMAAEDGDAHVQRRRLGVRLLDDRAAAVDRGRRLPLALRRRVRLARRGHGPVLRGKLVRRV